MVKCEYCGKKIGLLVVKYTWLDKQNNRAMHDECYKEYMNESPQKGKQIQKEDIKPLGKTDVKKGSSLARLIVILMIIIVLLNIASAGGYYLLSQSYSESVQEKQNLESELTNTQNELNNSNSQLTNLEVMLSLYESSLQENISELQILKSGDKYNLHDPTWIEAVDFLDNNVDIADLIQLMNLSKNEGIRCAYVGIITGEVVHELIGFNTLDYEMKYVEPLYHYVVYPEVGSNYYDCVENQPYGPSTPEDKDLITDILIIW
jgi:hypothetical protein